VRNKAERLCLFVPSSVFGRNYLQHPGEAVAFEDREEKRASVIFSFVGMSLVRSRIQEGE
jgi:hypothetical protein